MTKDLTVSETNADRLAAAEKLAEALRSIPQPGALGYYRSGRAF